MSDTNQDAPLTQTLAGFVSSFRAEYLPQDVLEMTLLCVRDGIAALLASINPEYSTGRLIADFAMEHGGKGESTLIGYGVKTDCVNAALANGTMGYACDIEPHHPEGILHPLAIMGPTALAVGERVGASGREFLAAVALGCEVEYRASIALGPTEQYNLGFHPSAVCGCFGATAASAYLLGLNDEAVVRAFGLAGCQASGMMAWETDPTENARPFQMGMAGRNGVTSALLAQSGFGGPTAIFDHGHTIFRAFSRGPSPDLLVKDLGKVWDGIMELAIKPYSSTSFLHPGLDVLIDIVRKEDLKPQDIKSLVMHFPRSGAHCVDGNPMKSHCAQYILPVAVVDRAATVSGIFVDRRLSDPELAALCERTRVVADEGELEKLFPNFYATIIEVETYDGRKFSRRFDIARGYPEAPMSEEELLEKFTSLVSTVAPPERVTALLECIAGLPEAPSLEVYADLLGRPAGT